MDHKYLENYDPQIIYDLVDLKFYAVAHNS